MIKRFIPTSVTGCLFVFTICACGSFWYIINPKAIPSPPSGSIQESYYQSSGSGGYIDFYRYKIAQPIAEVEKYYNQKVKNYCIENFQFIDIENSREVRCNISSRFSLSQEFYVRIEFISVNETRIYIHNSWEAP